MWKILVAFVVFAGVALFVISKGGDSLDMSGEKHGSETHVPDAAPVAASAAASVPAVVADTAAPAASAASN
ncbi:hypothetical protein [Ideonella sp.]|uniref:hypothetical protein n=1 Tax=Ideonella sp. TaxID=1929293 RepID=UPI003BB4A497